MLYISGQSGGTRQRISYIDPWPSWFLSELSIEALGFHISSISSKHLRPVLLALLFHRSYWYCQRSSHQINTQSFTGVICVEFLPLFETQRLPTRRLSRSDRFRPVPRAIISRLSLRRFPGVTMTFYHLWTLRITYPNFVTTCDYISHLTPHGFELVDLTTWEPG